MKYKVVLLFLFLAITNLVAAHGGRTNSSGGHNCSQKSISKGLCTGYHSHSGNVVNKTKSTYSSKPSNAVGPYSKLYDRSDWGGWTVEHGGCQNTRAKVLIASSQETVEFRNYKRCSVVTGRWYDPYSGKHWTKASDVDIDHIVPLNWAHGHGGQDWPKSLKKTFANDTENLIAVEDNLNQEKGAKSPDQWMPPNQRYRCEYVSRFNTIVEKYELVYVPSEKRIINRMLKACN